MLGFGAGAICMLLAPIAANLCLLPNTSSFSGPLLFDSIMEVSALLLFTAWLSLESIYKAVS